MDTVGLVVERERLPTEIDALRYSTPADPTAILWEKWFYCKDLGKELPPVMKEYFASAEHASGLPSVASVNTSPPLVVVLKSL